MDADPNPPACLGQEPPVEDVDRLREIIKQLKHTETTTREHACDELEAWARPGLGEQTGLLALREAATEFPEAGTDERCPAASLIMAAAQRPLPEFSKVVRELAHLFSDRAVLHVLGRKIERTRASALITFVGPGGVVMFRFSVPDVGKIVMFQTHLPIGPLEQQVDFHWMADRKIPRLLVSYVVGN